MLARISTTFLHYVNGLLKGLASLLIFGEEKEEMTSERSRRAVRHMRKLYQYDWYMELKNQYENNWDHDPAVLDFMSDVNFKLLHTEEGKGTFLTNFQFLLDSLNWK
ncbi:hypothetical protein MHB48_17700 [Psychrobacillus sp. FSL H8-0483]|uniref:hypothetical protein n=1 Tax=Psychrobacillus sp. FSL H8-0483 TaxID=2921389 RepID=UPI00315AB4F5